LSRMVSMVPKSAFWIFLRSAFQALSFGSHLTRARPQVEARAPAASTSQVSKTKSVQNSAPNNALRPWLCDNLASFVGDISLLSKSCAFLLVEVVLKSCRIRLSAPQSTNVLRSVCSKTSKACSISLFMGMRGWRAIFYVRRTGIFSGGGFSGCAAVGVPAQLSRARGACGGGGGARAGLWRRPESLVRVEVLSGSLGRAVDVCVRDWSRVLQRSFSSLAGSLGAL